MQRHIGPPGPGAPAVISISDGNRKVCVNARYASLTPLLPPYSGEDFHPTSNSLIHGTHVPSKEGIDRMVDDVEKQ